MLKYDLDPVKYPAIYDNKFGITDIRSLLQVESDLTQQRGKELLNNPSILKGTFGKEYFLALHKHLFQDVYPWAGEVRTYNVSKENATFCPFQNIDNEFDKLFPTLMKQNYGKGQNIDTFSETLAKTSDDLNAIHPFREGNGRSKRLYLQLLALNAGYNLDYSKVSAEQIKQEEVRAFYSGKSNVLAIAYRKCLSPLSAKMEKKNLME